MFFGWCWAVAFFCCCCVHSFAHIRWIGLSVFRYLCLSVHMEWMIMMRVYMRVESCHSHAHAANRWPSKLLEQTQLAHVTPLTLAHCHCHFTKHCQTLTAWMPKLYILDNDYCFRLPSHCFRYACRYTMQLSCMLYMGCAYAAHVCDCWISSAELCVLHVATISFDTALRL